MSLIDQRILIVAPVETVWVYVSDPMMLTKWHRGCKQVSVLTTRTTGQGTRRRCVGENGKAVVEETTAWFENIGYEYMVVDGPYRDFRGRFRLQAVPEGTIVNWTVEYHLRGMLSGVRNVISFRRQFEDLMTDSLRNLRRTVESSGVRLDPEKHARFAMQSAPSVEARAARTSEPPTRPGVVKGTPTAPGALRPVAVSEDDVPDLPFTADVAVPTVMRVPPSPPETESLRTPPPAWSEPQKLLHIVEPPVDEEDTKPRQAKGLREDIAAQHQLPSDPIISSDEDNQDNSRNAPFAPTVPISMVAPPRDPEPLPDTQTMEIVFPEPSRSAIPSVPSIPPSKAPSPPPEHTPPTPYMPPVTPAPAGAPRVGFGLEDTGTKIPVPDKSEVPPKKVPPPTDKRDSGEVSIWDVFGVSRPSERTQAELEAAIANLLTPAAPPQQPDETIPSKPLARRQPIRPASRKAKPRVRGVNKSGSRLKTSVRARAVKKSFGQGE